MLIAAIIGLTTYQIIQHLNEQEANETIPPTAI